MLVDATSLPASAVSNRPLQFIGIMPKIVFIVPGLNVGGAEHHTLELRARLSDMGFPTLLLVHGRKRSKTMTSHRGAADAVYLDLKGMSDLAGWFKIRDILRREAPDVIVTVNQMPLIVAVAISRLTGLRAKIVSVFHTTMLQGIEEKRFFLYRLALRLAHCLVFVSANQERYWRERKLYCRRSSIIRNGVDFERFKPDQQMRLEMRKTLGFAAGDIVLGLIAAFRPEKNHVALIEAASELRGRGLSVKVVLVGDGPTRPEVAALVKQRRLDDHVVFAGEQADVRPYIACSDIGVLCSISEAMPFSALEFLAMEVPMVISNVGGASEIVHPGVNGWLVDPSRSGDLVDQLFLACQSYQKLARERSESLSVQGMTEQYAKLLCEIV